MIVNIKIIFGALRKLLWVSATNGNLPDLLKWSSSAIEQMVAQVACAGESPGESH
jgi:hypothetical protein